MNLEQKCEVIDFITDVEINNYSELVDLIKNSNDKKYLLECVLDNYELFNIYLTNKNAKNSFINNTTHSDKLEYKLVKFNKNLVKILLKNEKITYKELVNKFAERGIQLSEQTITAWFKRNSPNTPTREKINVLADILKVSPAKLILS